MESGTIVALSLPTPDDNAQQPGSMVSIAGSRKTSVGVDSDRCTSTVGSLFLLTLPG
jgi:hypothetical protein